jgi:hypothetical protein
MDRNIKDLLTQFMKMVGEGSVVVYNEFSLQHELGIYLRQCLPSYNVQFERNAKFFGIKKGETIKHEIDIVIFNDSERYAIELKYPLNGQYPELMYAFVKDIKFMEDLNRFGFKKTYCLILVEDKNYYLGKNKKGIYAHFRCGKAVKGTISKPTGKGKNSDSISIEGEYDISWLYCISNDNKTDRRYCLVEVPRHEEQHA